MKDEILRILEMEKQGKLTTEQAAELLAALADKSQAPKAARPPRRPSRRPAPTFSGPKSFATMRGVVSTGGVIIADAVQAAVKSAMMPSTTRTATTASPCRAMSRRRWTPRSAAITPSMSRSSVRAVGRLALLRQLAAGLHHRQPSHHGWRTVRLHAQRQFAG